MIIELSEQQVRMLQEALHDSIGIAKVYRKTIADEDSIILAQNLRTMGKVLGIVEPEEDGGRSDLTVP